MSQMGRRVALSYLLIGYCQVLGEPAPALTLLQGETMSFPRRLVRLQAQKSIPPMPPPPGIAGAAFFSGISATIGSVVTRRPATEAAPCSAKLTTLGESMMPAFTISV